MHRYLPALVPLFVGTLACGGNSFTSPEDDGGTAGHGGAGGGATTTTIGSTITTSSAITSGPASGPGTTGTGGSGGVSTSGSGGVGSGGDATGGTGGQVVDAHVDAPIACDLGAPSPVTFRMIAAPGASFCGSNCSNVPLVTASWLTILAPGATTPLTVSRGCFPTCDECQPIACVTAKAAPRPPPDSSVPPPSDVGCAPPQLLQPEGETYTWSGALWASGQCGAAGYSCVSLVCGTPPGKYVARMCASRGSLEGPDSGPKHCSPEPTLTCVDVPFDYPATGVVEGVLR